MKIVREKVMAEEKRVLLVVDIQTALLEDKPYCGDAVLRRVGMLIAQCRERGVEIIYARHDGGMGDKLEHGTSGWEIDGAVAPLPGDQIFDKRVNSAFRDTGLSAYLDERGVRGIILVGMQTEYCIDASCKSAFERGYEVVIPEGAFTTYDNDWLSGEELNEFYTHIWDGRFAKVLPLEEVIQSL